MFMNSDETEVRQKCYICSPSAILLLLLLSSSSSVLLYLQSTTNKMKRFTIYLFLQDGLHVSDGFYIHNRELKTAHTASGICQTITATLERLVGCTLRIY